MKWLRYYLRMPTPGLTAIHFMAWLVVLVGTFLLIYGAHSSLIKQEASGNLLVIPGIVILILGAAVLQWIYPYAERVLHNRNQRLRDDVAEELKFRRAKRQ